MIVKFSSFPLFINIQLNPPQDIAVRSLGSDEINFSFQTSHRTVDVLEIQWWLLLVSNKKLLSKNDSAKWNVASSILQLRRTLSTHIYIHWSRNIRRVGFSLNYSSYFHVLKWRRDIISRKTRQIIHKDQSLHSQS